MMNEYDNFPKPYVLVSVKDNNEIIQSLKFHNIQSALEYIRFYLKLDYNKFDFEYIVRLIK